MLAVCGHIHEARGVERVRWNTPTPEDGRLVKGVEGWEDPGAGANKKQSLVNLSVKGGRQLENESRLTRQMHLGLLPERVARGVGEACGGQPGVPGILQPPSVLKSTSRPGGESEAEEVKRATGKAMFGGAFECRQEGDVEGLRRGDVEGVERKHETVVINAAFLGPRIPGKSMQFNKPVVVDVDLPAWTGEKV
ncbi:hypothetical protein P280DRAFT_472412 [Massarina eburnea CBS 473.64]|uniref:Uncharacterized protein n=1 Tax=Massarina eburnea CBS 473.64 TaxID=1395130 RepID=A0A6A6RSL4_9PLEO|nr:hypothetical protein P280DRAFT_472412 [Massarina eburnea CBS 473.64]